MKFDKGGGRRAAGNVKGEQRLYRPNISIFTRMHQIYGNARVFFCAQLPVRSYSLVDKDVWQMSEIRGWFDSHSSPQPVEGFDPLASGYAVSADKVR